MSSRGDGRGLGRGRARGRGRGRARGRGRGRGYPGHLGTAGQEGGDDPAAKPNPPMIDVGSSSSSSSSPSPALIPPLPDESPGGLVSPVAAGTPRADLPRPLSFVLRRFEEITPKGDQAGPSFPAMAVESGSSSSSGGGGHGQQEIDFASMDPADSLFREVVMGAQVGSGRRVRRESKNERGWRRRKVGMRRLVLPPPLPQPPPPPPPPHHLIDCAADFLPPSPSLITAAVGS